MNIINVINKLPWKNSNGKMNKTKINILVIHHNAVDVPSRYNSLSRLQQEARTHIAKLYGHISYHYSIDNTGNIYQCLSEDEVAYHCGNLSINKNSIAIKFDGNFEFQKPTLQQIKAYQELITWLTTKRPDLPKITRASIKGHRQIKATACPGKNLYPLITKF